MELTIGICDDNPFYCKILNKQLKKIEHLKEAEIDTFYTSSDFFESMKVTNYDIVFMYIELDNHNSGLDLALYLKEFYPTCLIIYVSSFDDYYIRMVKSDPFYFLHKPVEDDELLKVIERAIKRIGLLKNHFTYFYKFNGLENKLNLHDVLFFESYKRIIIGYLRNHSCIKFYEKLDDLEKNVEEIYPYFLRVSKSYLVNYHYCFDKYKNYIYVDDCKIRITGKYRESYKKKFELVSKTF